MIDTDTSLVAITVVLNLLVTIAAFVHSKVKQEKRLVKIETLVEILVSRAGLHVRTGDVENNYSRKHRIT